MAQQLLNDECQELFGNVRELVSLRKRCVGMSVVDLAAHEEVAKHLEFFQPLAKMHSLTGEKRACAVFDWQYVNGLLPEDIANPDVESKLKREHKFNLGKYVDRAITHADGRITLIELKDSADERAIVAGIGQVLWYAAMAETDSAASPVVPVLAVLGEPDQLVARACERAGVRYFPMGSIAHFKLLSMVCDIAINYGRAKKS